MFLSTEASLVGENCPYYDAANIFYKANMTYLARNCANCCNYTNGGCNKKIFNEIYENLSIN